VVVGDSDFKLDLRQVSNTYTAPRFTSGAFLVAAETFPVGDDNASHAHVGSGSAPVVELERLVDGHDHLLCGGSGWFAAGYALGWAWQS